MRVPKLIKLLIPRKYFSGYLQNGNRIAIQLSPEISPLGSQVDGAQKALADSAICSRFSVSLECHPAGTCCVSLRQLRALTTLASEKTTELVIGNFIGSAPVVLVLLSTAKQDPHDIKQTGGSARKKSAGKS